MNYQKNGYKDTKKNSLNIKVFMIIISKKKQKMIICYDLIVCFEFIFVALQLVSNKIMDVNYS